MSDRAEFEQQSLTYNGNIIRFARQNWVILMFVGALVVGWSTMQSRLATVEKDIAVERARIDSTLAAVGDLRIITAEIGATLREIKDRLDRSNL